MKASEISTLGSSSPYQQSQDFLLEGVFKYNKSSWKLQLLNNPNAQNGLTFSPLGSDKKISSFSIDFNDILGIERFTSNKRDIGPRFVIYTFALEPSTRDKKRKQRSQNSYLIECDSEEIRDRWVHSLVCLSKGVFIQEKIPQTRLMVFVNPAGGSGQAVKIWKSVSEMFDVAGIQVDVVETKYHGHAQELTEKLRTDEYDGIVAVSGDGILNEVVNGLLQRKGVKQSDLLPLGIIPGGSGNGIASTLDLVDPFFAAFTIIKGYSKKIDIWSVTNEQDTFFSLFSFEWAIIAQIDKESERMRWMGGFRFTVEGVKQAIVNKSYDGTLSYIKEGKQKLERCQGSCCGETIPRSQWKKERAEQWGNEIFLEEERMHQMAQSKLKQEELNSSKQELNSSKQELNTSSKQEPNISSKQEELNSSKQELNISSKQELNSSKQELNISSKQEELNSSQDLFNTSTKQELSQSDVTLSKQRRGLPSFLSLKFLDPNKFSKGLQLNSLEGGQKIERVEGPFSYVCASQFSWLSEEHEGFPYAHPSDGFIDLAFSKKLNLFDLTQLLLKVDNGAYVEMKEVTYQKVQAFRIDPAIKKDNGYIMLDGEEYALKSFHFEIHPRVIPFFFPKVD